MRYRVKLVSTMLAASLGTAALLAASAGTASADTSSPLLISSFYQVVADSAHGHLFVSQGSSSSNNILVTDLTGHQVGAIPNQNGVMGIALSPDGSTLYAALASNHAVTAIDTSTLTQTASYPIGSGNTPQDVAVQSGKVWVSYNTGTVGAAAIGDIDLTAITPAFETQSNLGGWYSAPQLAADPQDTGNVLLAAEPGLDPTSVATYDTSAEPATVRASSGFFTNCENEGDLAVVPGGAQFILACGWPYAHFRYSTADLSQQGSYASTTYPDAVGIAPNGDVAAGTANGLDTTPDIYVYQQGADTPLNAFNSNSSGDNLMPRGLAWSADESELFAVLKSPTSTFSLQVIDKPTLPRTTMTLKASASAIYITHNVTLTGKLVTSVGGTPLPAGTPITVKREIVKGTPKVFDVTTQADGTFSLTDKPPTKGIYVYIASYAGSSTAAPSSAFVKVTVKRLPTSLKVTTDHSTYSYDSTVHVTAHLGATYTNRTVSIYARSLGSSTKKLLVSGKVNAKGNLTAKYVAPHSTEFYAEFTGDAHYVPVTVTRTVGVRVKVTEKLGGYYGTTSINGRTFKLYHPTAHLDLAIQVAPNKHGQCVKIQVQEHFGGTWHTVNLFPCIPLNRYSKLSGYLLVSQADRNVPYRIRADFFRSSTDVSNLNNHSGWQYFKIES